MYWPYKRMYMITATGFVGSIPAGGVLILKDENRWRKWVQINSIFDNSQSTARTRFIER